MICKNKLREILVVQTSTTLTDIEKNDLLKSTSSKNHAQIKNILTSSQFTECVQHQVLNQIQQQIYKLLLFPNANLSVSFLNAE